MNAKEWLADLESQTFSPKITRLSGGEDWIYEQIKTHVEMHKYLLETRRHISIDMSTAFYDWLEYVFDPLMTMVWKYNIPHEAGITPLLACIHLSDHWMHLKEAVPIHIRMVTASDAAVSYLLALPGKSWVKRVWWRLFTRL
jgi:hypothetical protein